ncbi:MAG: twin-arginine translocase subunit TatC [Acidimicrobiales bacterium]
MTKPSADEAARMTLFEHLAELRTRLVISVVAVAVGGAVAFATSNLIVDFLIGPYCDLKGSGDCALVILDPLEGFATRLKIAGFGGLFLASPVVLWQVWRFVTPGLNHNEKRYAVPFILSSILLFVLGATLAILTFPRALEFLIDVGGPNFVPLFSPSKYLRLILLMVAAFGIAFEFPVLLMFLQLAGVLSSRRLRSWRRGAIIGIFVVAAVITPSQDPITLMALAVPMYLFYEAAILIGRLLKK